MLADRAYQGVSVREQGLIVGKRELPRADRVPAAFCSLDARSESQLGIDGALSRYFEHLGVDRGALVVQGPDGALDLLAELGLGSAPAADLLVTLARAVPFETIRTPPRWVTCSASGTLLFVPLCIWRGQRLAAAALFPGGGSPEPAATAASADRLAPDLAAQVELWLGREADRNRLAALTETLDGFAGGVLLLDEAKRLLFANRAARALLLSGKGLRTVSEGIGATDLSSAVRLQTAIDHLLAAPRSARARAPLLRLERPDGSGPLIAILLPVGAGVACYILDSDVQPDGVITAMCRLHALSPVETQLTALLATGTTLSKAAGIMRIKEHTARSYMKRIFAKTGTNRQADLVRVLLTSAVTVSNEVDLVVV